MSQYRKGIKMILRSLFEDDMTLSFELVEGWDEEKLGFGADEPMDHKLQVKARMGKGDEIDVPDMFWGHPEIVGAINMGLIELVGKPPKTRAKPEEVEEKKVRLVNKSSSKLAFECIKDYVEPGQNLWVPESKMDEREIQNALDWGLLQDPSVKEDESSEDGAGERFSSADLEEVSVKASRSTRKKRSSRKTTSKKTSPMKAKKITKSEDSEVEDGDDDGIDLFSESKVIDTKATKPIQKETEKPAVDSRPKPEEVSVLSGLEDIFGEDDAETIRNMASKMDEEEF